MSRRRAPTLETLYEDDDLHAVAKPSGLATVSDRWQPDAPTVIDELWKLWKRSDPDAPRPHLIHRLDRETTGVILFARNKDAQRHVRQQFRERRVKKRYVAIALGTPDPRSGTIEVSIDEDSRRKGKMKTVNRGGKDCSTSYEVTEGFDHVSLVRLEPLTGRTHQIRVSLAHIGHPCAVDPLYGGKEALYLSEWKRDYRAGRGEPERPLIDRVTLHAERLQLDAPNGDSTLTIEAPLPRDFAATVRQLRRWR